MDMRQNIVDKLQAELTPAYLDVRDESHMHNVPSGAQSHFKVTVAAAEFSGQSLVNRHRRINRILAEELAGQVHALALHTLSEEEWQADPDVPDSPPCRGGSKVQPKAPA